MLENTRKNDQVTYGNVCKYLEVHDLRWVNTSRGVAGKAEGLEGGELDV